jgi:hypothetical protein
VQQNVIPLTDKTEHFGLQLSVRNCSQFASPESSGIETQQTGRICRVKGRLAMKRIAIFISLASAVVLGILAADAIAQTVQTDEGALQNKYHVIQVQGFAVQPGVDFPSNYLASLPQQLVQRLKDSKKFTQALTAGEKPSQEDAAVMGLSGTVTGYDPGSRGKRYVGFGMGAARVFVTLKYSDVSTGQILYEDKVIGALTGGVFGGAENKTGRTCENHCSDYQARLADKAW